MPFCPQCGVDNPAAARYCDQCGSMLIPAPAPPAAVAPAPAAPLVSNAPVCSQCGTPAIPGEAFCDNCGAPLGAPPRPIAPVPTPPSSTGVPAQPAYPPPQSVSTPVQRLTPSITPPSPVPPPLTAPPAAPPPAVSTGTRSALAPAQLVVVVTGAIILLPNTYQAVVGRADPVSNFFPDLDLTPFGALDNGVGRRHVRLFVLGAQVMVEDLESTNGTKLNGQRLLARQPQPLNRGDILTIGKLELRFQE